MSDGGSAGELTDDHRAIWQVTLAWAQWQRTTPLRAIRALAPHVTGARKAKNPRHALYSALPARGTARPTAWVDAEHGPWEAYAQHWSTFRARVAELVNGAAVRPCPGANPIAWGDREGDVEIALRRGLVQVSCGETRNAFWQLPPERVLSATVARGER